MKNNILKDSNALLGFLISEMDNNGNCNVYRIFDAVGRDKGYDIQMLVNELSENGYAKFISTTNIHVSEKGKSGFISKKEKIWLTAKKPLSYILTYVMGIVSGVVVELIVFSITSK